MRVAVIGECMVEMLRVDENVYQQTFGGDTFNCAVYFKRELLEARVEYITVLGRDNFSNKMLDFFKSQNIDTNYVDFVDDKNAGLYMVNTCKGERSFDYYRDTSAAKELFTTQILEKLKEELPKFNLIYFSAITLAIMSKKGRKNLFDIIKKARKSGVLIAYDSNYRPRLYKDKNEAQKMYKKALKCCDIFLPSLDDEKALFGDITIEEIIQKSSKYASEIVIKSGDKPIIFHVKKTKQFNVKPVTEVVDTTSAGDSFNGVYLALRLKQNGIKKSIKKASQMASRVIMIKGAIIPQEKL